jgi:hypothetical protein
MALASESRCAEEYFKEKGEAPMSDGREEREEQEQRRRWEEEEKRTGRGDRPYREREWEDGGREPS